LFGKSRAINLLAGARVFLFGARDVWFVVGVPVFLYSQGWNFTMVGTFMALWTIAYGLVQALAPKFIRRSDDGLSAEVPAARLWSFMLMLVPAVLAAVVERLRPGGRIVIPLATIEALAELRPLLERAGFAIGVSQHQAWRGAPLADGTRLAPLTPVLVLKGCKP
jgi:hypothetical protein